MSRLIAIFMISITTCCLSACGPREIGQGTSSESHVIPDAAAADMLRFPVTGMNSIQHRLYWQNKPEVMMMTQKSHADWFRRHYGHPVDPQSPGYRAVPKQRSPFRQ